VSSPQPACFKCEGCHRFFEALAFVLPSWIIQKVVWKPDPHDGSGLVDILDYLYLNPDDP